VWDEVIALACQNLGIAKMMVFRDTLEGKSNHN